VESDRRTFVAICAAATQLSNSIASIAATVVNIVVCVFGETSLQIIELP
jgi:hypothetical protein